MLKIIQPRERVAQVTLNRPERRNAIGTEMIDRLTSTFAELDRDSDIGAIVLAAAPPAFCAGSDLKELAGSSIDEMCHHEAHTAALARRIGLMDTPVVAAVAGYALGGGFILAASCDLVVTHSDARWHLPEVPNGWIPPWGLEALTARVGPVAARRLTWGAEPIDGAEAHRIGVADYIADDVEAEAVEVAVRLAMLPAAAVASTKRFFQDRILGGAEVADDRANRMFADDCTHPVAQQTLAKFGAKK